ncbi:MAG: CRISPR-associated protein Cas4 [candidate division Zixibacteria bacterium]|nr:CRISPR-associated protein Cas4 [candidate division Zixibacteria bacterium]
MYHEDDYLPIAALQHLSFCERQWGLIYLENVWADNILTADGKNLHEHADEEMTESRVDVVIARGLRLSSPKMGLSGIADVVEFHEVPEEESHDGAITLDGLSGKWRPYPVEYKRGKPKLDHCDLVQVCAQALCLEEMTGADIPEGAIYYGKPKKRTIVRFDDKLRSETTHLAERLHRLTKIGRTPLAKYEKKCRSCSIYDYCLPKATYSSEKARRYISSALKEPHYREDK